jgi:hypothetical protein
MTRTRSAEPSTPTIVPAGPPPANSTTSNMPVRCQRRRRLLRLPATIPATPRPDRSYWAPACARPPRRRTGIAPICLVRAPPPMIVFGSALKLPLLRTELRYDRE